MKASAGGGSGRGLLLRQLPCLVVINRVQGVSRGAPFKVSNESEAWSVKTASSRWDIIKI